MNEDTDVRPLRGMIGNALVWGGAFSALWVLLISVFSVLGLLGVIPGFSWTAALGTAIRFGVAFGVVGFVAGGAFSGIVRLLYRGRRISQIGSIRFGIGGGIVSGLAVPLFLQSMNLLSGSGLLPMELLYTDIVLATVFGGVAAGGSLALAKRSDLLTSGEASSAPLGPG